MTSRTVVAYLDMIRRLGVRRALAAVRHRASERYHERRLGIETAEAVPMTQLGITNPGHAEYAPSVFRDFQMILDRLAIRDGTEVLVDFGSGKGRALIMAARCPFRRIIGVEFSPELNDIAVRNLETARHTFRCRDVSTVVADAARYDVPDDVTVAYFNNPFDRPLFDQVLDRLRASLARRPRRFRLVLNYYPDSPLIDAVRESEWLTIVDGFELEAGRQCAIANGAAVTPAMPS
jgi:SAM-dependent methyltransferase